MSVLKSSSEHIGFEELTKLEIPVALGEFAVKTKGWANDASQMLGGATVRYVPIGLDVSENSHDANVLIKTRKSNTRETFLKLKNKNVIMRFEPPTSQKDVSFTVVTAPPADQSVAGAILSTSARLVGSVDTIREWQKFTVITTMKGSLSKFLHRLEQLGDVQVLSYQSIKVPSSALINAGPDMDPNTRAATYYKAFRVMREAYLSGFYGKETKLTLDNLAKTMASKGIEISSSTLANMMKRGEHLAIEGYLSNPAMIEFLKEESKINTQNTFDLLKTKK